MNKSKKVEVLESIDLLSSGPKWIIRWGVTMVFLVLLIFSSIGWFVKYPDSIPGSMIISSDKRIDKIEAPANGLINNIYFNDGDSVKKNDVIAILRGPLDMLRVNELKGFMADVRSFLSIQTIETVRISNNTFGPIQQYVDEIYESCWELYFLVRPGGYRIELSKAKKKLEALYDLRNKTSKLIELYIGDLEITTSWFQIYINLHKDSSISKSEYLMHQSVYNVKKIQLRTQEIELVRVNMEVSSMELQLARMKFNHRKKLRQITNDIVSGLNKVRSEIELWEENKVIKAPSKGVLSSVSKIDIYLNVNKGELLFAILPMSTNYTAVVNIPANGSGRIQKGDRVILKVNNFPANEFGSVMGEVSSISRIPELNRYNVIVSLPEGLKTTYGKSLSFKGEMIGIAEIITQDKRLIQRILHTFKI